MRMRLDPWQGEPQAENGDQQREDDGLEHLDALGLGNGADGKGEDGGAAASERGCEADGADVEMLWEEFGRGDLGVCIFHVSNGVTLWKLMMRRDAREERRETRTRMGLPRRPGTWVRERSRGMQRRWRTREIAARARRGALDPWR